jgi:hypothetical protein
MTGFLPKSKKEKKYADMIIRYAAICSAKPYNLVKAKGELLAWINGTYEEQPPLDISYCKFMPLGMPAETMAVVVADADTSTEHGTAAMALEPAMLGVRLGAAPRPRGPESAEPPPSAQATFVCSMASTFMKEHGYTWRDALDAAEKCWKRFPKHHTSALAADGGSVADPAAVEDASLSDDEMLVIEPFR